MLNEYEYYHGGYHSEVVDGWGIEQMDGGVSRADIGEWTWINGMGMVSRCDGTRYADGDCYRMSIMAEQKQGEGVGYWVREAENQYQ